VWRNSGNDFSNTHFRDGLMHRLVANVDVDRLAYRPSRAYVNGQYWGIMNIRERLDEDYIAANNGVDADNLNLIKNFWAVNAGSAVDFWAMWNYIEDNDLADNVHFDHVATEMDVDNYADYQIIEIFAGNHDWGTNNNAWWKTQTENGKWRWILYDTDAGLGLQSSVEDNSLARALLEEGTGWPSATFRTHILRNLVRNEQFRDRFINRFCDHLNTTFAPVRTLPIAEDVAETIEQEIPRHLDRWDRSQDWDNRVLVVVDFLSRRPDLCRQFLRDQFDLAEEVNLNLNVQPAEAGRILLNSVSVDSVFDGTYFAGVPIQMVAQPAYGYTFTGWSDTTVAASDSLTIAMGEDMTLTAIFEVSNDVPQVVINEINYHSAIESDPGDWVELHNPGPEGIDISGWVFKDGNDLHEFTMPAGTVLGSQEFLVLCTDLAAFAAIHPQTGSLLGDLGFGFSGAGETLRVFDNFGTLLDSVTYDDVSPWPLEADGAAPPLMLTNPLLDNTLASSWAASPNGGTPGAANIVVTTAADVIGFTRLDQPHPNPFNPRTEIDFHLARDQRVQLNIYDLRGHMVKTLAEGHLDMGHHHRFWDGLDQHGRALPSGTYIFRLKLEDMTMTRKTLLLR